MIPLKERKRIGEPAHTYAVADIFNEGTGAKAIVLILHVGDRKYSLILSPRDMVRLAGKLFTRAIQILFRRK